MAPRTPLLTALAVALVAAAVPTVPVAATANPPTPSAAVAVSGADYAVWSYRSGQGFTSLGGTSRYGPAVADAPAGSGFSAQTFYIVTGLDRDLWVRTDGAGWRRLSASPVSCLDSPAAVVSGGGAGVLEVACQGTDHSVWYSAAPITGGTIPVMTRWVSLGGVLTAGPAITSVAGMTVVFGVGQDRRIWMFEGGRWQPEGWLCIGHPVAATAGGVTTFGCEGLDGALWMAQGTPASFGPAVSLGGRLLQMAGVVATSGHVTLYADGANSQLWEVTPGGAGWVPAGGRLLPPNAPPPPPVYPAGLQRGVTVGGFVVDLVTADLTHTRVITDSLNTTDCPGNCPATNIAQFARQDNGFAAINATYLCPPGYTSCSGANSFNYSLYNSRVGAWINAYSLPWSNRSLLTFNGTQHTMYGRSNGYGTAGSPPVTAGLAMGYGLIAGGQRILEPYFGSQLSSKELTRMPRSGIGVRGTNLYLVVGHAASEGDLATIFQALGCDSALALDGGGSTALWFGGGYVDGPGRDVPNAIVLAG